MCKVLYLRLVERCWRLPVCYVFYFFKVYLCIRSCYTAIWTWNYICASGKQPQGKTTRTQLQIFLHIYTYAYAHTHTKQYVLIENPNPFGYSTSSALRPKLPSLCLAYLPAMLLNSSCFGFVVAHLFRTSQLAPHVLRQRWQRTHVPMLRAQHTHLEHQ